MPRTRSNKLFEDVQGAQIEELIDFPFSTSVAMVNKPDAIGDSKQMKKKRQNTSNDNQNNNTKRSKIIKKSKSTKKVYQEKPKQWQQTSKSKMPRSTSVSFNEGDEFIQMSVQEGEELDYEHEQDNSQIDEDPEVSFRNSQTSEVSQSENENEITQLSETSDGESDHGEGESTFDEDQDSHSMGDEEPQQQNTLEEIDHKLQMKLMELQTLVKQKGLKGSAKILDGIAGNPQRLTNNKQNRNVSSFKEKTNSMKTMCTNDSEKQVGNSTSEETIYDKALPKRVSSSSEDAECDTSDEMLQFQFDQLNVLQGSAAFSDLETRANKDFTERRSLELPQPSTSSGWGLMRHKTPPREPTPEE